MSSESQQLTWQGQGLPSDGLSAQNALAILHGVQTLFIIDPSLQVCGPVISGRSRCRGAGRTAACLLARAHTGDSLTALPSTTALNDTSAQSLALTTQ